jgi:hypothetical protein
MFLSIFYPGNRPLSYAIGPKAKTDDVVRQVRDVEITEPEWRSFVITRPDGTVTLRCNTDVGSILTVADVSLAVDTSLNVDLKRFDNDQIVSNIDFMRQFEDNALRELGFDPHIDFELWMSSDSAMSVADAVFGLYRAAITRMRAKSNIFELSEIPPRYIDIWIYRDRNSFARTLKDRRQSLVSQHFGRSFALITPRGAEIHAVVEGDLGGLRTRWWNAGETAKDAVELRDRLEEAFHDWVHNNLELIGTISHELDHTILAKRDPGRPLWWIEGQATYFGELVVAIQSIGMESHRDEEGHVVHDPSDQTLARTCFEANDSSKCDSMMQAAIEAGKLASPRSTKYKLEISRLPQSDLRKNIKRLLLTPAGEFHEGELEELNYALSWALTSVILQASREPSAPAPRLRNDLQFLSSHNLAAVRDGIFAGQFESAIDYLARNVHSFVQRTG